MTLLTPLFLAAFWIPPLPGAALSSVSDPAAAAEAAGADEAPPPPRRHLPSKAQPTGDVLLVPDSTGDRVSCFDRATGAVLGDLILGQGLLSVPIDAVQGPDGNLYVSDQIQDAVFVFDVHGQWQFTYADASDGLDNVRGIAFRGGHLFVTLGKSDADVVEFAGPHQPVSPPLVNDASDPFDIHFLPDGSFLLSDIGPGGGVRHYDAAGQPLGLVVAASFPEQVRDDPVPPGDFLLASFSSQRVDDFDLAGTVVQQTPLPASGRAAYRLPNGHLLVTGTFGVLVIDPATGSVVATQAAGSGWRFIEEATLEDWFDLGFALPGALGPPLLAGQGVLAAGSTVTFTLSQAVPNSVALLVIGVQNLQAPFLGGTLVPSPDVTLVLSTGPSGSILLSAPVPPGLPSFVPIHVQFWIADAAGPAGAAASNAIVQTTK